MLQPDAFIGTNSSVLGDAKMRDTDGGDVPRERESAVVHL
jgi:hypothetical protein